MWTAISCALGVGVCLWLADGSSSGVRAVAALIGLGVGLLVVLLIAWALAPEENAVAAAAAPEAPTWVAEPLPAPVVPAPVLPLPAATPPPPPADLAKQLEAGRSLAADPEAIDTWIDETRSQLGQHRPGVLGYFAALGSRTFPDEQARLDAHLARLETIVRDMA